MSVPFCFAQESTTQEFTPSYSPSRSEFGIGLTRARQSGGLLNNITTLSLSDSLSSDTTIKKPSFKKFRMKKSPWLAVGLSAVLPGAGQFYNQSYWKVPIILGFVGYLGYEYYNNDKKYRDYRNQYAASQNDTIPEGDPVLKYYREFYFNQRNDFVWYFMIVYVINLIDAYIDAHLFDFSVKEDKIERFGTSDKEYKLNVKIHF
jgi:TM2 domain-containing membrane protein YozV